MSAAKATEKYLDEMDRNDKVDWIKTGLLNGETYDRDLLAEEFEVSEDTVSRYLADASNQLEEAGVAVDAAYSSDGTKEWFIDAEPHEYRDHIDEILDTFDYVPDLDEFRERELPELHSSEDQAKYIADMFTGANRAFHNKRLEGQDDETNLLYITEPGFGTRFHDDHAWDGLVESVKDDDIDAVVFNGDVVPWVPKWSYKTARQQQEILDEYEDKEPNVTAQRMMDKEYLKKVVDDDMLPDDDADQDVYLDQFLDHIEEDFDLEANKQKITDIGEAVDVAGDKIGQLQEAVGDDIPLYFKFGEGMQQWVEDTLEYKIAEFTEEDELEERMQGLDDKIDAFYDILDDLKGSVSDEVEEEVDKYVNGDVNPLDIDLDKPEFQDEDEELYSKAVEKQKELADHFEDVRGYIRDQELNLNAMMVERAFGEYAQIFGRTQLDADQTSFLNYLAKAEVAEAIHPFGNVKGMDTEPGLVTWDINGAEVDVAHNLNVASDEPLKSGYQRMKQDYKKRSKENGDLFLVTHHGEYGVQPINDGRGEEFNDPTYMVMGSTLMDAELLEEHGLDDGQKLNKDVKRIYKGLHDGTASMVSLQKKKGPDGEFRKAFEAEGWDVSDLKEIGLQLAGKRKPGQDATEQDLLHFMVRGDDHFGSPHMWEHLNEPLLEDLVEEDFHWMHEYMDDLDEDEREDVVVVEMGDALHGYDNFEHQQVEGKQLWNHEIAAIDSEIVSVLEGDDVDFETRWDLTQYRIEHDLRPETEAALAYVDEFNRTASAEGRISRQKDFVADVLVPKYEELMDRGATLVLTSGNHDNGGTDTGHDGASDLYRWFDSEYHDQIEIADGERSGHAFLSMDDLDSDVVLKSEHSPKGYGREPNTKALRTESGEDVATHGHYHKYFFGKKGTNHATSGGSNQATNEFVKSIVEPGESPSRGASYLARDKDSDTGYFRTRHVFIKGITPMLEELDE